MLNSRGNVAHHNSKGFTLIELIVVVAVLLILTAVAIPSYLILVQKADTATEIAAAAEYVSAINLYNAMNPSAKIVGTGTGTSPSDDDIDFIKAAGLNPVTEFTETSLTSKVLARIIIDAKGLALVGNKENIP
ncbi:MAG: prepilin-type N-terminal cleavage/methylation domain-containing protein [Saccharofermentanales bacterium]